MDDPGDREIRQMAEDHYNTITQGLLNQENDYAVDWKIISRSVQNSGFGSERKLMLKCKHVPSDTV